MKKHQTLLTITVVGIIISFLSSFVHPALSIIATVIAIWAAYAQYTDSLPFEFLFTHNQWNSVGNEFQLSIPFKQHKKINPLHEVYMQDENNNHHFNIVMCDGKVTSENEVIISALRRFEGKVIIK